MSNTTTSSVVNCQARAYDFLVQLAGTRPATVTWDSTHCLQGHAPPRRSTSSCVIASTQCLATTGRADRAGLGRGSPFLRRSAPRPHRLLRDHGSLGADRSPAAIVPMASPGRDMGTYAAMPDDALDARALLEVAPDQYVTERTRVVKQARADKDKARVAFYQGLKRPSVRAVGGTGRRRRRCGAQDLGGHGGVGRGASRPRAVLPISRRRRKRRRTVLESFVDKAVERTLAMFDNGAEKAMAGTASSTNFPEPRSRRCVDRWNVA